MRVLVAEDHRRLAETVAAGRRGCGMRAWRSTWSSTGSAHGAALATRAQPHGGLHIEVGFPLPRASLAKSCLTAVTGCLSLSLR
jgi:hypothetical protein